MGALGVLLFVAACNDNGVDHGTPTVYAEEAFSYKVAVGNQTRTRLQGINGRVRIVGATQIDSFVIAGHRRVGSSSVQDAEDHLHLVEVIVTDLGDEVHVRTEQPAASSGRSYSADYELSVPEGIEIDVSITNGEIQVVSIRNTISARTTNGDVALQGIEASATAATTNGRISADVVLPTDGGLDLSTANGHVTLQIPVATSADLTASLANGTIEVLGLVVHDLVSSRTSLRGTLGAGEGLITLRTVNGDITVSGF
jgi:hypothetical protein